MDTAAALNIPVQIQRYFDTLNSRAFAQTADLFALDGQLVPPFEKPIQGREAIAHYLATEANEMTVIPLEGELESEPIAPSNDVSSDDSNDNITLSSTQIWLLKGKVKTSLFVVKVAWQFELNTADSNSIKTAEIKLIASLNELLKFKR